LIWEQSTSNKPGVLKLKKSNKSVNVRFQLTEEQDLKEKEKR